MALTGQVAAPLTTTVTINSSNVGCTTTETLTDTITVSVVAGETYKVEHTALWGGTTGTGAAVRLREDSVSGTPVNGHDVWFSGASYYPESYVRGYWTAAATGTKTFVATGQGKTTSCTRAGSSTNPSILSVTQQF